MAIEEGDAVKVNYVGKLDDGSVFDRTEDDPIEITPGEGELIEGFEEAIIGMEVGDEKEVTLSPDKAYGERDEDLKKEFSRDEFPPDFEPKEGMFIQLNTESGRQVPGRIMGFTDEDVAVDLNHPLAGEEVTFEIEIVEIS